MDMVQGILFVCCFLVGLCAIAHYTRNSPLPFVCWIVLFGIGYGFLQKYTVKNLPWIHLSPDVIMYVFLPVLIYDSTRKLDLKAARAEAIPSLLLATLGILAGMFVMAVPVRLFSGLSWLDCLFFCSIMSATDPVAVASVFKVFPVPEKLKMLVEGESLLNDATTVIVFTLMFERIIHGQELNFRAGLVFFAGSVIGAVLIGAVGGWVCASLLRHWKALKSQFITPMMPLLFVYLVFCIVQGMLDFSGVIAVMSTTLTMKLVVLRFPEEELPCDELIGFYRGFWDFLSDLTNAVLFFILGAEIGAHSADIRWRLVVTSVVALLLARSVVVYGFGALFNVIRTPIPVSWMHVLNLGGLKGALSVALIMMIPTEYAYRNSFLLAALVMSLFTLIVNTLGLRVYLKKADLGEAGQTI